MKKATQTPPMIHSPHITPPDDIDTNIDLDGIPIKF